MKHDRAHYDAVWRAERALGGRNKTAKAVVKDHPARIPTRLVTSKKGESKPEDLVDMESFRSTPDLYKKNIDLVRDYPNMRQSLARGKHDAVAQEMIRHVKENLLWLHDKVPAATRKRSKLWYDGARAITDNWSKQYGLPDHSVAGALAALSPQKDWYQNVSLAHRVLESMKGDPKFYNDFKFSPEMQANWESRPALQKPEYKNLVGMLQGKSLADIDQLGLPDAERATAKAMWIRMHDEAHRDPSHPLVMPEGTFGSPVLTNSGAKAKMAWGSLNEISKAVRSIEEAGNPAAISGLMGERHKVRSFYNNILEPNSRHGDVTMDTHAIAAGLLRPLSGNSLEVSHNFANYPGADLPTAGGSALTGIQGLYPLYAEAYRQAAKERGLKPRELQSITWEAVRGLFPDTFKTPVNNARVDDIWRQYRRGRLSQSKARDMIHDYAGGIRQPTWLTGVDETNRGTADAAALPGAAVYGPGAGAPDSGAGSGLAPAVPQVRARGGRLMRADGGSVDRSDPSQTLPPGTPDYIKPIDEGARRLSPIGLYSHAAEETWKQPQMKGSPEQFKAMLQKRGVKPDEFKWSGYDQAFAGKKSVSKREVRDHFVRNLPKIEETVLGEDGSYHESPDSRITPTNETTKFHNYALPGGRNYREVVMHLPKKTISGAEAEQHARALAAKHGEDFDQLPRALQFQTMNKARKEFETAQPPGYQSSHWDEPNVLAHLRLSDRKEGSKKILHLEELQSDWAQEGRDKGFKNPEDAAKHQKAIDDHVAAMRQQLIQRMVDRGHDEYDAGSIINSFNHAQVVRSSEDPAASEKYADLVDRKVKQNTALPIAPYVDTTAKWTDLGLKRALWEAAKGGYDRLVVTPGEEQAKRYDLSRHIRELRYYPPGELWGKPKPGELYAYEHGKNDVRSLGQMPPEEVKDHVGKEVAERLLATPVEERSGTTPAPPHHKLTGQDLRIGGEGMKGYYDKILPGQLEKLARQHDAEARVKLHADAFPLRSPYAIRRYLNATGPRSHYLVNTKTGGETGHYFSSPEEGEKFRKSHPDYGDTMGQGHVLDITPKMRASILQGHKAYASGGAVNGDQNNPPEDDATDDALYHVTLTKHLPKIQKEGIRPLQTSNWVQAGNRERYGGGHIFAFDHPHDAEAWGARMDWDHHKQTGSGKVSIVKFKRDGGWQKDTADPLSQSSRKGSWLKKVGSVKPGQIVSHAPVTTETVRGIVKRNNQGRAAGGRIAERIDDHLYRRLRKTPDLALGRLS